MIFKFTQRLDRTEPQSHSVDDALRARVYVDRCDVHQGNNHDCDETEQPLTMKVGNRNHFFRLASVKIGGRYSMELCVDWTYQEFMLEDKRGAGKKLFVNSDDCCDYERITVKELEEDGKLLVVRVPRKRREHPREEEYVGAEKGIFSWRLWM